jgi:hypothetical protein
MKRVLLFCAASAWLGAGTGCVQAGSPQVCSVAPGNDAAQLGFRELHSFGKNYEVFQLMVKLDDCVLFQSEDTSVLDQPEFNLPPKPLAAGVHQLQIVTKFKSGFSADMHDYEWFEVRSMRIELSANATRTLVVRRTEVMNRDPRKRMQSDIVLE